ncbi:hypothetical protein FRX31_008712 [Thalictrum thalictroides]|nr:hypothetical protein FRX31_008712 [Thalictrum thalictroides]
MVPSVPSTSTSPAGAPEMFPSSSSPPSPSPFGGLSPETAVQGPNSGSNSNYKIGVILSGFCLIAAFAV